MEKVNDATPTNLPFAELVPDTFPARGLVKALSHLLTLVKVARVKNEVFEFTNEVIIWLSMKQVLEMRRAGKSYSPRVITSSMCGLVNGLAIADEIRVFKEKLTAARELLSHLQVNTLVVGVDAILDQIRDIKNLQKSQLCEILDHLEDAEDRERFLQQTLFKVSLSNTTYDDQDKPPCDEDTCVGTLTDIKRWVDNISSGSQNFFWLSGDPGCGKSAITASLARYCKDSGTLWAQFFINRSNEATTQTRFYFPSIARQMTYHAPDDTITKPFTT